MYYAGSVLRGGGDRSALRMWKKGAGSAAGRTLSNVLSLTKPALSTVEGGQSSGEGNDNGRVGTSNIVFQHSRSGA